MHTVAVAAAAAVVVAVAAAAPAAAAAAAAAAAVAAVMGLGRRCKHGERPALELVKDQKGREQEQDHQDYQDQDQGQAAPLQEERAAVLLGGALYELLNAEAFCTYN